MRRLIIGLLFAAALSTPGASQAPQPAAATVYEGARLIVGDGRAPIEDSAFIVENNRFSQVGRKGQLKIPAGAARVDLTGKTVMPASLEKGPLVQLIRRQLSRQALMKNRGSGNKASGNRSHKRCRQCG